MRHAAAALLFALAAVVGTWPLFSRPWTAVYDPADVPGFDPPYLHFVAGERGPAPPAALPPTPAQGWAQLKRKDTLLNIWTLAWGAHALATAPARVFEANTLYPTPNALAHSDHQLGVLPLFAPAYWATGNPVLAYQLALLTSMAACAFLFFLLVRRWTGRAAAGAVAGLVAAFAPYHLRVLRILIHYSIQYLPAALLCVDALLAGRRRPLAAAGLAACMTLQALCSIYAAYMTFLLVPVYALVALAAAGSGRGRAVGWLAAAALASAAGVVLVHRPYLAHLAGRPWGSPPAYNWALGLFWLHSDRAAWTVLGGGVGLPVLILAALGLLERHSGRRAAALALVLLGVVLAVGPRLRLGPLMLDGLPWAWLARWVPGFALQRHPYVAVMTAGIGLACLAGLGAAWVLGRLDRLRPRTGRALVAALALVVLAATLAEFRPERPRLLTLATGGRVPRVYRWLAAHGGGRPLLELPASVVINTAYAYFSTYHWLPLFNGGYAVPPSGYVELVRRAGDVLDPVRATGFLRTVPVRWVVVHEGLIPPPGRPDLEQPRPHLRRIARFGEDVLFEVEAAAP